MPKGPDIFIITTGSNNVDQHSAQVYPNYEKHKPTHHPSGMEGGGEVGVAGVGGGLTGSL